MSAADAFISEFGKEAADATPLKVGYQLTVTDIYPQEDCNGTVRIAVVLETSGHSLHTLLFEVPVYDPDEEDDESLQRIVGRIGDRVPPKEIRERFYKCGLNNGFVEGDDEPPKAHDWI